MAKKQAVKATAVAKPRNAFPGVIQFEPCAAPMTKGKGIGKEADDQPVYSLKRDDGRIFVYGVADCQRFGEGKAQRLNSFARYKGVTNDYLDLLKVQWLHMFASHRGGAQISPTLILTVPISVYNNDDQLTAFKAAIAGDNGISYVIDDVKNNPLKIAIKPNKLIVIPESSGALYHFQYDPKTMEPRGEDFRVDGNVVVIDGGNLTTNYSLHVAGKYDRREQYSFTETNMGMGLIASAIRDALSSETGNEYDVSEIDQGLQAIAGAEPGPKTIYVALRETAEVSEIYDPLTDDLAASMSNTYRNHYKIPVSLVVESGGSAYHLEGKLRERLHDVRLVICPDPDVANAVGAFTMLRRQARTQGAKAPLLGASDTGNGGVKCLSIETFQV